MGVRYSQELADRAQAWVSLPLHEKRSGHGLDELARVWAAIQGVPLPSCMRQCQYSERAASVAAYLREFSISKNPELMSDSQYQIVPAYAGEKFIHESYNKAVTADNLTDEDAEFFIKNGFGHAFVRKDGKPFDGSKPAATPEAPSDYAKELAAEQQAHEATTGKLNKEADAHAKSVDALKAEKEAHKATKSELSEVQKLVKELQKQLAKAMTAAPAAPAEPAAPDAQ